MESMSNKLFLLIKAYLNTMGLKDYYSDYDEEDIEYFGNEKVNDVIFNTYMDILKLDSIEDEMSQDAFMNAIADTFQLRLATLSEKEQEYVKRKIHSVLMPEEDKPKTLEKNKNN